MVRLIVIPLCLSLACVPADPPDEQARPEASASAQHKSTKQAAARPAAPGPRPARASPPPRSGEPLTEPFRDDFNRQRVGSNYYTTSPVWRIRSGRMCAQNARNHPAWLAHALPVNARIEFDAVSKSPEGDIKVEAWGNGRSAAQGVSYEDASSYLFIFGGWKNQLHVLARLDEHGKDRRALRVKPKGDDPRARPVRPGHLYHFKIERRDGKTVRWFVDDVELHTFEDPNPLKGPGHQYFAFNNWQVPVCFDNLVISPLE